MKILCDLSVVVVVIIYVVGLMVLVSIVIDKWRKKW